MKHRWIDKRRTYGSWRMTCARCGIIKDARFCGGTHWTEYLRRGEGELWFTADKVPACRSSADEQGGADRDGGPEQAEGGGIDQGVHDVAPL